MEKYKEELKDWETCHMELQTLRPIEVTRNQLKEVRIPTLAEEIKGQYKGI